MSNGYRQAIEVQAQALGSVLHAGVATSLTAAHKHRRGLEHAKYPHLLPLLMRAEMREFLEANPLPNGWAVGGDSRLMGQLLLRQPDLNIEMRFLKERRRTYPNGVPTAGTNHARRAVWDALPLDWSWAARSTAPTTSPVSVLLLWDFLTAKELDQFTLRIVHTLSPGVFGKAVPCDLILDVNDGGEIFKRLSFSGSPDDHDFFSVEVDEEDNESGS